MQRLLSEVANAFRQLLWLGMRYVPCSSVDRLVHRVLSNLIGIWTEKGGTES